MIFICSSFPKKQKKKKRKKKFFTHRITPPMPEAAKSSINTSSSSDSPNSTIVNDCSQNPQLTNEYNYDPLTPPDEEWGEPWMEYDSLTPWIDVYSTTKEIYEQAVYITGLRRGSQLSVFRRWRDCLKV